MAKKKQGVLRPDREADGKRTRTINGRDITRLRGIVNAKTRDEDKLAHKIRELEDKLAELRKTRRLAEMELMDAEHTYDTETAGMGY